MSQNKKNKKQKKGYYKKDLEYQQEPPAKDTKYEISSSDEEKPPDFSYLLNSHASSSSHLILKTDEERFQKSESVINTSRYFNVDINLLNNAIKSVPFHEIYQDIGIEWSCEEINRMNEEAKVNEEVYKSLLASFPNENSKNQEIVASPVKQITKVVEDLAITQSKTSKEAAQPTVIGSNNKESMEKWLDDVLDI